VSAQFFRHPIFPLEIPITVKKNEPHSTNPNSKKNAVYIEKILANPLVIPYTTMRESIQSTLSAREIVLSRWHRTHDLEGYTIHTL